MRRALLIVATTLITSVGRAQTSPAPAAQNPSPMVERTRRHERLVRKDIGGITRAIPGPSGKMIEVWIPERALNRDAFDLVVHFHGEAWLPSRL